MEVNNFNFYNNLTAKNLAEVVQMEWGLPCMKEGIEALSLSGHLLMNMLQRDDISPTHREKWFPNCIETHWRDFWTRLNDAKRSTDFKQGNSSAFQEQGDSPDRRNLQSVTNSSWSGLHIKQDNSIIYFGKERDAALYRSEESTLTVDSHLIIEGNLTVLGTNLVANKRCATIDMSGYNGTYEIPVAPADGDFILPEYVKCSLGSNFQAKSRVRWVCKEEGGVAHPSQDVCFYSVTECHDEIDNGGWKLVRRIMSGSYWHPATDSLTGTDEYGTFVENSTIDATFSRTFDDEIDNSTQFLFAAGDCTHWLVANKSEVLDRNGYFLANIETASDDLGPHQAYWYNRPAQIEDPWISLEDHSDAITGDTIVYGEDSYSGNHVGMLLSHNGANVFIRQNP